MLNLIKAEPTLRGTCISHNVFPVILHINRFVIAVTLQVAVWRPTTDV
jgi:hypothetical protein